MDITESRDFDIRVGFNEGEFKAIEEAVAVLGFSNRAGFIRFHINQALLACEEEVNALKRITGRALRHPPRAVQRQHSVSSHAAAPTLGAE